MSWVTWTCQRCGQNHYNNPKKCINCDWVRPDKIKELPDFKWVNSSEGGAVNV